MRGSWKKLSLSLSLYIYIYMCVCVCVRAQMIENLKPQFSSYVPTNKKMNRYVAEQVSVLLWCLLDRASLWELKNKKANLLPLIILLYLL